MIFLSVIFIPTISTVKASNDSVEFGENFNLYIDNSVLESNPWFQDAINYAETNCHNQNYFITSKLTFNNGSSDNHLELICMGDEKPKLRLLKEVNVRGIVSYHWDIDLYEYHNVYVFQGHEPWLKTGWNYSSSRNFYNGSTIFSDSWEDYKNQAHKFFDVYTNSYFELDSRTGGTNVNSIYPGFGTVTILSPLIWKDQVYESGSKFLENGVLFESNNTVNYKYSSVDPLDQLYSLDFYLYPNTDLKKLNIDLNYQDNNSEYHNKSKFSGYLLYGLIEENGLYHWEEYDFLNNSYKADFEEHTSDIGFNVSLKNIQVDFSKYKAVKLSLFIDNAFMYDMWLDVSEKFPIEDLVFNKFGTAESPYFRLKNDSSVKRYLVFSTKKDLIENQHLYFERKDENYLFFAYYNTMSYSFTSYDVDDFSLYNSEYDYYNYNIGTSLKLGFYLYSNKNSSYQYSIFHNIDVYYYLSNDDYLLDSKFIDSSGDIVTGDITIASSDPAMQGSALYNLYFRKFVKGLESFRTSILYISSLFSDFYYSLPMLVQSALFILFFVTVLICIISFIF